MPPTPPSIPGVDTFYDERDRIHYHCPSDTAGVVRVVRHAHAHGLKVRVRGSMHSEKGTVLSTSPNAIHVSVHRLQTFAPVAGSSPQRFCVGAGVSLGGDPYAPFVGNLQRAQSASLFHQLDALILAMPITGGISHQTISGFIATGADGGSLTYSFYDALTSITFIDGQGTERKVRRGEPAVDGATIDAVIASLGLLGIIVEVEIQPVPRFDIAGIHCVQSMETGDFPLLGRGGPTLLTWLRRVHFGRALLWAQPGVRRLDHWEACRHDSLDEVEKARWPESLPKQALGVPPLSEQALAALILTFTRTQGELVTTFESKVVFSPELFFESLRLAGDAAKQIDREPRVDWARFRLLVDRTETDYRAFAAASQKVVHYPKGPSTDARPESSDRLTIWEHIVAFLIDLFVPLSDVSAESRWTDTSGLPRRSAVDLFRASWHVGLPMDNAIDDRIMRTSFTEIWVPMSKAQEALARLDKYFEDRRLEGTGTYTVELYTAKKSSAWLSPACEEDVLRIDPFWLDAIDPAPGARLRFFSGIWRALAGVGGRFHWGKAMPDTYTATSASGPASWGTYPRLASFLELRGRLDEGRVFLTPYWSRRLGIPDTTPSW